MQRLRTWRWNESGRAAALAALLALATGLAGCYTMLRHPGAGDLTSGQPAQACARCHASEGGFDQATLPWVAYYGSSSYPWINYYGAPWWYGSRWEPLPESGDAAAEGQAAAGMPDRILGRWWWNSGTRNSDGGQETRTRDEQSGEASVSPARPLPAPRLPISAPPPRAAVARPDTGRAAADSTREGNSSTLEQKPKETHRRVLRR
jgi:hypothetical protein